MLFRMEEYGASANSMLDGSATDRLLPTGMVLLFIEDNLAICEAACCRKRRAATISGAGSGPGMAEYEHKQRQSELKPFILLVDR